MQSTISHNGGMSSKKFPSTLIPSAVIPTLKKIPVIAVTAYVLPGDKEKFIATGFTDFISKPIFREKLVESLNKIFVN